MANRTSLRKALLSSLIGALSLSALVGIYIFIVGDFGKTEIKILVTTLSLAYFSVCALGCSVALERGRARWLTYPGLASCVFGFVWSLFMIWGEWHREAPAKTMVIAVIAAFSLFQSCLLTPAPLRGKLRWVFGATLGAIFALAVLVSLMLIFEWEDELLFRLAGVLGILDAAGTLAVPILYKLGYARPSAPPAIGQAEPAAPWQIELACPRCGERGRYPVGAIRCRGCSLEIHLGVVEPVEDTPRRRFQFSLRSMLLLMLFVSLPLGWIGYRVRERAKQARVVTVLKEHGANVYSPYGNARTVTFSDANRFDATSLVHLKKLPRLKSINLGSMPISDHDLRHLEHLPLNYLGLAHTRVSDAGVDSLTTLRQLRSLNVEGTRIAPQGIQRLTRAIPGLRVNTGAPKPAIAPPDPVITALKKSGAIVYPLRNGNVPAVVFSDRDRFHPSALAQLNNLRGLEWVEFRQMPVSDRDLRHLGPLWLTGLGLAYTEVTDAGLGSLAKLTELRHLDLQGTRVTDAGLNSLVRLRQLVRLNLEGTRVTDAGLNSLATLGLLRDLDVRGTAVTPQGVQRLKRAIPGLQVNAGPRETPKVQPPARQDAAEQ